LGTAWIFIFAAEIGASRHESVYFEVDMCIPSRSRWVPNIVLQIDTVKAVARGPGQWFMLRQLKEILLVGEIVPGIAHAVLVDPGQLHRKYHG
jgi:hypothetical protein